VELTIHQARFGQNEERGFALLDTTHPDAALIRRLSSVANLTEYPPDQLHWEPALRGFAWDEFYVLLKTFPDNSPGMRPNRVFSHALLLDIKQLTAVPDLRPVLDSLPIELNKGAALASSKLVVPSVVAGPIALTPRLGKLLQLLVLHADTQPIIWADQPEFRDAVCLAWQVMWPALRRQFRFGIGFSVRDVKATAPQLLAVPSTLLGTWHNYPIIKPTDTYSSLNEIENYLVGNVANSPDLSYLLESVESHANNLSDLISIQAVAHTAKQLAEATLPDLLALASVIGTLQPSPARAVKLKKDLTSSLVAKVASSNLEDLIQARTFGWQAEFGTPATSVEQAITKRFAEIISGEPTLDLTPILTRLGGDTTPGWWSDSIKAGVRKTFAVWKPRLAPLVYSLWAKATHTTAQLLKLLPTRYEIEADLVAQVPLKLSENAAQAGENFAQHRQWLTLHMACALQRWPLNTALTKQLVLDTLPDSLEALRYAKRKASAKEFVIASAELADNRLIKLAGELCTTQPDLLELLNVSSLGGQQIWLASLLAQPTAKKAATKKLVARTWDLFDHLIAGGEIISGLLGEVGKTAADLRAYPLRAEIWEHLKEGTQDFLFATAVSIIQHEKANSTLEKPLSDTLSSHAFIRYYLTQTTETSAVLDLLAWSNVPESAATEYLYTAPKFISSTQAQQFGKLIAVRAWASAASRIFSLAQTISAFRPALVECLNLLPTLNKFVAIILVRNEKKVSVKKAEWWQLLLTTLREVYPKGPTEDKIWLISGGSEDIINTHKNGKEQWADLLYRLQKNPPISIKDFVNTLVNENRKNQTFRLLYDLLIHDINV
jgi:hypothetical protein